MEKIDVTQMSEETIQALRKQCLRDFFSFCVAVMGYDDLDDDLHGQVCHFLEGPEGRKQLTLPRSFVKTWIGTIAYSIWIALPRSTPDEFPEGVSPTDPFYLLGPNIRILIASYVIGNAMKMIGLIRKTYERNQVMMFLFPEVIPENFNKTKWSDTEACIRRSENFTESTFEAGGIGGSTTSRHYDLIIEDDLIYAKKDDFSGQELQPSQEDIDKAIGWHKLAMSLLVPGAHTRIHNIGTRWAKHDLVDYIRTNEKSYKVLEFSVTKDGTLEGIPTWPKMYPTEKLRQIRDSQGVYMFSTQYLNLPMAPEDTIFKRTQLQFYSTRSELPKEARIFTTCDLSLWSNPKRKKLASRGVVLTCGWDSNNHVWLIHYDVGRFNPSEMIDLWYQHYKCFHSEIIGVEAVYYQKALMFFAQKEMKERGFLPVRELKTDSSISKELRIRALEPYAMNNAIHCLFDHKDFIQEFCEFIPNKDNCTKDLLDALAYQLQVARPGQIKKTIQTPLERLAKLNQEAQLIYADDFFKEIALKKGEKSTAPEETLEEAIFDYPPEDLCFFNF